jgi:tetratricopeptide (TPR) repeat protein
LAVQRAPDWPRALLLAAEIAATDLEEPALALQYLSAAFTRNPRWIPKTVGNGVYASLGPSPEFRRWADSAVAARVLAEYRQRAAQPDFSGESRLVLAARLLETGNAAEALAALERAPEPAPETYLLRASALAALGQPAKAIEQCRAGLRVTPGHPRLQLRLSQLQSPAPVHP